MPARHCIAVGCTTDSRTSSNDVSFYQLLKVESELKKWLRLVKCGELEVENKELRKENEILKSREVDFRKELLNNYFMTRFHFGKGLGGQDPRNGKKNSKINQSFSTTFTFCNTIWGSGKRFMLQVQLNCCPREVELVSLDQNPACLQIHDVHGCFLENSTCTTTIPNDPKSCENEQPPVDGQWSEFISHGCTECSVTCGNGSQKFIETRECNNPIPENGGNTYNGSAIKVTQRACNVQKCQVDGQWSEFISLGFTECSVTCGNGSQKFIETRECNNPIPENGGNTCNGSAIKVTQRACNVQKCHAYEEMPKYSEWSDCSATCGIGAQIRVRLHACSDEYFQSDIESNTSGTELETRSCKIRNCQYFKNYPFISIEFLSSICVATILSFLFGIWVRSITCKRPVKEERDYANTGHNQIQRTANERYSNYHLRYDVVESCEDVPEYSSCDDAIITHGSWQQTEKMKYYNDSLYGEPCSAPHIKDQCSESEDSNSYYCNTVTNMVENKMDMENNEYENIGSINM
ncbi:semaphorin-5A-like [Ostrea edulis]|uniref:semaphorin-5A-like n=1 Tax=Ostrea edulis TaxID=37623 RepID=UPI0024AEA11D|nr:semaphorin-5A-like [Ostrea edulis]